ncbi:helix-turn-helix domain-containing protein [Microbacterium sp. W4I20]|uniref:helix-turn-helix domain-containing protein n=1 Tax=Microbacterium sp. W4I20 TaxID=3042262 RepID=UPI00358E7CD4
MERGLSQEEVAMRADIALGSYGCLERGRSPSGQAANPTFLTILRVFSVLGISGRLRSDKQDGE